jgi:hypothetical protein
MKILLVHNTHFSIQTKVIVKGIAQQFDRNSSIRTYHYASINNTQELTAHNNLIETAVKVFCRRDTTTNHYASINNAQ